MNPSSEVPLPREYIESVQRPEFEDGLRHECAVLAICDDTVDAVTHTSLLLERMKHRGHDSAGVALVRDGEIYIHSRDGAPENLFTNDPDDTPIKEKFIHGEMEIAGTRYATTGDTTGRYNRQPFPGSGRHGEIYLVINGNIADTNGLFKEIKNWGFVPKGNSDSEMMVYWLANGPGETLEDSLINFMEKYPAGYSGVVMTKDRILGFRDAHGIRPLQMARTDNGWALASETRAFRSVQYHPTREVEPGEIIRLQPGKRPTTVSHKPNERRADCLFERIYFSGPESQLDGEYVGAFHDEMGRILAREDIARGTVPDVDLIFGVPESGVSMGEGYQEELARHGYAAFHKRALVRTRGRSFNDPDPRKIIEAKFNPLPHVLRGKRILVVDDSIVRGNTGPYIVEMLRAAGATEVHFRIASPPFVDTCHFGVNIAARAELIANQCDSLADIARTLDVNSLQYLSLEGTLEAAQRSFDTVCAGCLTGTYPIEIPDKVETYQVGDELAAAEDRFGMLLSPQSSVR